MKKFIFGLIIGVAIGLPIGVNMGKGVPILSNPFADKPLSEHVKDTAEAAKKGTSKMVQDTKKAIHDATK